MNKMLVSRTVVIAAIAFVIIIVVITIVTINLGRAYKGGLASFINQNTTNEVKLKEKKEVKRITIKKRGQKTCMQVTPDGIVRIFNTCGGDLTDATRLPDPKHILELFKIVTETDLSKLPTTGKGEVYTLTIETDHGTETVFVVLNSGSPTGGQIGQIIQSVTGDLPQPAPSTTVFIPTPTAGGSIIPVASIFPGSSPGVQVTPSANPAQTFSCGFSDVPGKKKPMNVSNVICSTQPSPIP